MGRKPKPLYDGRHLCPHCDKSIRIKIEDVVKKKAIPAEKKRTVTVEKDAKQKTISDSVKK